MMPGGFCVKKKQKLKRFYFCHCARTILTCKNIVTGIFFKNCLWLVDRTNLSKHLYSLFVSFFNVCKVAFIISNMFHFVSLKQTFPFGHRSRCMCFIEEKINKIRNWSAWLINKTLTQLYFNKKQSQLLKFSVTTVFLCHSSEHIYLT